MLLSMLDTTRDDLLRSLQARAFELEHGAPEQPRQVIVNRELAKLTESRAQELQQRMADLIQEFCAADQSQAEPAEETHLFAMTEDPVHNPGFIKLLMAFRMGRLEKELLGCGKGPCGARTRALRAPETRLRPVLFQAPFPRM